MNPTEMRWPTREGLEECIAILEKRIAGRVGDPFEHRKEIVYCRLVLTCYERIDQLEREPRMTWWMAVLIALGTCVVSWIVPGALILMGD